MRTERTARAAIEEEVSRAFSVAERARSRGLDPAREVEIPIAKDMADRVENLLGFEGIAARIRDLEGEVSRERAALELARGFAEGDLGDLDGPEARIDAAVRTAVALLTEGVVAAPIEGIDRVAIETNPDGTRFVRIWYAGPIRSAGGTAQALSVLVADYTRTLLGLDAYRPTDAEIGRTVEEIQLYERETGLQYTPTDDETAHIATRCPVMLDGEPTTDAEVDSYRDLDRIETNRGRGGMCLVLAEGIAQKANKLARYVDEVGAVEWPWLDTLRGEQPTKAEADRRDRLEPDAGYLKDLIAGRPVLAHPSEPGAFRLRYGRARNHGLATAGVHPATMHLLDDFIAPGTQLKTERPGKAAGVVPVDTIEGPTVRMADGSLRRLEEPARARELRGGVTEIVDLGEYLVNVGEFVENNHPLVPGAYDRRRWEHEMALAGADLQAARDAPDIDLDRPDPQRAIEWARTYDVPLHPHHTYLYHDLTVDEILALAEAIETADLTDAGLVLPSDDGIVDTLRTLLVEHESTASGVLVPVWRPLAVSLGFDDELTRSWDDLDATDPLAAVNAIAPFPVRAKAPTRIGARMGRPEKSESRELSPAVHCLFPVGAAGGDRRSVEEAATYAPDRTAPAGEIEVTVNRRRCTACGLRTFHPSCPSCGGFAEVVYTCPSCGDHITAADDGDPVCRRCDREATCVEQRQVDIDAEFEAALDRVDVRRRTLEIVKGVQGLTSARKTPEPLEKGVLRAVHELTVFKDGTVRYDMTDLPVTAVRPEEIDVDADTFRELGYETDIDGEPLRYDDQVVELASQDVILSRDAAEHLFRTANFVDDLLESYYGFDRYYDLEGPDDLVGELVLGLAPHTSAAVVGRVVGFTNASVGYAHPFFHAAKRRNCFHPATKVWIRDERGRWRHEPIEAVVERRMEDPSTDDVGTRIQELAGDSTVPSIDDTGRLVERSVTAVSKHPAPDHLVRIRTRSGREITVTSDHEIQVFDGDGITAKRASALTTDDTAVIPAHVDPIGSATQPREFDLLDAFLDVERIDNNRLTIEGLSEDRLFDLIEERTAAGWEGNDSPLERTAERLGVDTKELRTYLRQGSVPSGLLLELFDSREEFLEFVPRGVSLGMRDDWSEIDRFVRLNGDVAALLGFYAAEGSAGREDTTTGTVRRTTVCGTDPDCRDHFVDILRREFGVDPFHEQEAPVTVPGRLLRTFFDTILDAGIDAETKRVPQPIFDSPDSIVGAYLNGYFAGNGAVQSQGCTMEATAASSELTEDLLALLTRLGICAQVRVADRARDSESPDDCDPDDPRSAAETYVLTIPAEHAVRFAESVEFARARAHDGLAARGPSVQPRGHPIVDGGNGDYLVDPIASVAYVESNVDNTYCLTVEGTHSLVANNISIKQCDGDEDSVMLLMDGLLNFSESYLPDARGGSMDAPLVLSTRIDPSEIDDEAHNIETVDRYPLELYEAAEAYKSAGVVGIPSAGDAIDEGDGGVSFRHTNDSSDIAAGPSVSSYKTLESMEEKLTAQLELARKLRAVDEADVAERVIEGHYLPDLLGNLRAFSSQEVRCRDCGWKYRRVPLTGSCHECGGTVSLTVYEGMVVKYLETAKEIAEQYDVRPYTKQRLEVLDMTLSSLFEDDTDKQAGIADFM